MNIAYITWHSENRTMEATFNIEPNTEELSMALVGMMLGHGISPEVICKFILNYIEDERRLQDLPMVPTFGDYGLHGSVPG